MIALLPSIDQSLPVKGGGVSYLFDELYFQYCMNNNNEIRSKIIALLIITNENYRTLFPVYIKGNVCYI